MPKGVDVSATRDTNNTICNLLTILLLTSLVARYKELSKQDAESIISKFLKYQRRGNSGGSDKYICIFAELELSPGVKETVSFMSIHNAAIKSMATNLNPEELPKYLRRLADSIERGWQRKNVLSPTEQQNQNMMHSLNNANLAPGNRNLTSVIPLDSSTTLGLKAIISSTKSLLKRYVNINTSTNVDNITIKELSTESSELFNLITSHMRNLMATDITNVGIQVLETLSLNKWMNSMVVNLFMPKFLHDNQHDVFACIQYMSDYMTDPAQLKKDFEHNVYVSERVREILAAKGKHAGTSSTYSPVNTRRSKKGRRKGTSSGVSRRKQKSSMSFMAGTSNRRNNVFKLSPEVNERITSFVNKTNHTITSTQTDPIESLIHIYNAVSPEGIPNVAVVTQKLMSCIFIIYIVSRWCLVNFNFTTQVDKIFIHMLKMLGYKSIMGFSNSTINSLIKLGGDFVDVLNHVLVQKDIKSVVKGCEEHVQESMNVIRAFDRFKEDQAQQERARKHQKQVDMFRAAINADPNLVKSVDLKLGDKVDLSKAGVGTIKTALEKEAEDESKKDVDKPPAKVSPDPSASTRSALDDHLEKASGEALLKEFMASIHDHVYNNSSSLDNAFDPAIASRAAAIDNIIETHGDMPAAKKLDDAKKEFKESVERGDSETIAEKMSIIIAMLSYKHESNLTFTDVWIWIVVMLSTMVINSTVYNVKTMPNVVDIITPSNGASIKRQKGNPGSDYRIHSNVHAVRKCLTNTALLTQLLRSLGINNVVSNGHTKNIYMFLSQVVKKSKSISDNFECVERDGKRYYNLDGLLIPVDDFHSLCTNNIITTDAYKQFMNTRNYNQGVVVKQPLMYASKRSNKRGSSAPPEHMVKDNVILDDPVLKDDTFIRKVLRIAPTTVLPSAQEISKFFTSVSIGASINCGSMEPNQVIQLKNALMLTKICITADQIRAAVSSKDKRKMSKAKIVKVKTELNPIIKAHADKKSNSLQTSSYETGSSLFDIMMATDPDESTQQSSDIQDRDIMEVLNSALQGDENNTPSLEELVKEPPPKKTSPPPKQLDKAMKTAALFSVGTKRKKVSTSGKRKRSGDTLKQSSTNTVDTEDTMDSTNTPPPSKKSTSSIMDFFSHESSK